MGNMSLFLETPLYEKTLSKHILTCANHAWKHWHFQIQNLNLLYKFLKEKIKGGKIVVKYNDKPNLKWTNTKTWTK